MFSGQSIEVKLVTSEDMIAQIEDWFGKDIRIICVEDGKVTVRLRCNEQAMRFWALQYGPYVEMIAPASLRNQIKEDVKGMMDKYCRKEDGNG